MRYKLFGAFLLLLISSSLVFSEMKFPEPSGYVNDYASLLSSGERQQLNALALSLEQKTSAELAIAIVQTVSPYDIDLYAVKLFEKWKIGKKSKDNGVLILLVLQERKIRIEVGYGLEGALPDALCGQILDAYAIPNFKAGQYGKGLIETAQAVSRAIFGDSRVVAPGKKLTSEGGLGSYFLYIIIALIILGIIFRKGGSIFMGVIGAIWGASEGGVVGAITGALIGFVFGFWGWQF
ncbi:MAG: TPM domain-containing protein, partial [Candidatus Margulisbacteria bacterium]|nr:TPM domain-containing protein [Candidatus Margulisiibacteriota bacterium]